MGARDFAQKASAFCGHPAVAMSANESPNGQYADAMKLANATAALPPEATPSLQLGYSLVRNIRAWEVRTGEDVRALLELDRQLGVALRTGPPPAPLNAALDDTLALLRGDAEHLLSLAKRLGVTIGVIVSKAPEAIALQDFWSRKQRWFTLPNNLRNDVEHGPDFRRSSTATIVRLGYGVGWVRYATSGPGNPGREIDLVPGMVTELLGIWDEFLAISAGLRPGRRTV